MKLIKFKGLRKGHFTEYKTETITYNVPGIPGKTFTKEVKTDIPESVKTTLELYLIPEDKINVLHKLGEDCGVNDIKVSLDEFNNVINQLIGV